MMLLVNLSFFDGMVIEIVSVGRMNISRMRMVVRNIDCGYFFFGFFIWFMCMVLIFMLV